MKREATLRVCRIYPYKWWLDLGWGITITRDHPYSRYAASVNAAKRFAEFIGITITATEGLE